MNAQLKTIFLLSVLSAILIGFGSLLGSGFLYGSIAIAILLNWISFFYSDRIVLKAYSARELHPHEKPWLHEMVQELAISAEIPKPKLFLIPSQAANAFATGRNPSKGAVGITEGIEQLLSKRELRGVLAHEIAHLKNRDTLVATIAAILAASIGYLGNAIQTLAFLGLHQNEEENHETGAAGWIMAIVAPLIAVLLQFGISRSREYLADAEGARISKDPESLALALEKLELFKESQKIGEEDLATSSPSTASLFILNPLSGAGRVMKLFSTHPPITERIYRLRKMAMLSSKAA